MTSLHHIAQALDFTAVRKMTLDDAHQRYASCCPYSVLQIIQFSKIKYSY
ncbi:MAG: hypothetical protein OFPII_20110 [Osedax symbiont Rs1]|nr:MAG: hypothetical protein OFPII_20110 [Osedax symbiont Rs1]